MMLAMPAGATCVCLFPWHEPVQHEHQSSPAPGSTGTEVSFVSAGHGFPAHALAHRAREGLVRVTDLLGPQNLQVNKHRLRGTRPK